MRIATFQSRLTQDIGSVYDAMTSVYPVACGQSFTIGSFVNRLNMATQPIGIYNEIDWSPERKNALLLSGMWHYKHTLPVNNSFADVRVIWHCNPKHRTITLSKQRWDRCRFYLFSTMGHELIHRYQFDLQEPKREPKQYAPQTDRYQTRQNQLYMGRMDEIETYAFEAAFECFIWWPTSSLSKALKQALTIDSSYARYRRVFAGCYNHPAVKQYRRKVEEWYAVMLLNLNFYESLELVTLYE